jgi:hypothetical protein
MKAATVISTKQFDAVAEELLSADELAELEFSLATDPTAHPVIPGTNGVRKARWARAGMGKRGGMRVIYFYAIRAELILLLAAYTKNQKENLTNDDKKAIRRAVEGFEQALESGR